MYGRWQSGMPSRFIDELPKDLAWFNAREIEAYFAKGSGRAP